MYIVNRAARETRMELRFSKYVSAANNGSTPNTSKYGTAVPGQKTCLCSQPCQSSLYILTAIGVIFIQPVYINGRISYHNENIFDGNS